MAQLGLYNVFFMVIVAIIEDKPQSPVAEHNRSFFPAHINLRNIGPGEGLLSS